MTVVAVRRCRALLLGAALESVALLFSGREARGQGQAPGGSPQIEQRLGASVTMSAAFRDERGDPITLAQASGGRPVVLALVYYRCPMLCNQILNGLLEALVALPPSPGTPVSVIAVSFDPRERPDLAAAKRAPYLKSLGPSSRVLSWRFLTGSPEATERLCRETGFGISFDSSTGLYAHASALVILTPQGTISRYLMGVRYPAADLGRAIADAGVGQVGGLAERLLLLCYRYDPSTGKYTLAVWTLLRGASLVTLAALGVLLALLGRSRRNAALAAGLPPQGGP
ncbi:MAG TPA: SCO family protein [Planctomycetota bacterium]|nr:SCO family protein [Planctomycetota bacterium]